MKLSEKIDNMVQLGGTSESFGVGFDFAKAQAARLAAEHEADPEQPAADTMTLRDQFAMRLVPALLQSLENARSAEEARAMVSQEAYAFADAMLKERDK